MTIQKSRPVHVQQVSVKSLLIEVVNGDYNLSPARQRGFVWNDKDQESFLKGMILNPQLETFFASNIILTKASNGGYEVADGKQRLTTILYNLGVSREILNIPTKRKMYEGLTEHEVAYLKDIYIPVIMLDSSIDDVFPLVNLQKKLEDWDRDRGSLSNIASFAIDYSYLFEKFFGKGKKLQPSVASTLTVALMGGAPEKASKFGFGAMWKECLLNPNIDPMFTPREQDRVLEILNDFLEKVGDIDKQPKCGTGFVIYFLAELFKQGYVSDRAVEKFKETLYVPRKEFLETNGGFNRSGEHKGTRNNVLEAFYH